MPEFATPLLNDDDPLIALCTSAELQERGLAVPFDVVHAGQSCRAFAVRYQGRVVAYLNRCSHVAMEMDWRPNRFFDDSGRWLLCATHGATYEPFSGACAGGPCRGGLVAIPVLERDGVVYWQAQYPFGPLSF
ncbi:MAG: Rieske 2Fe-2S domain-containing protein [Burkholderiaceae bacterium]